MASRMARAGRQIRRESAGCRVAASRRRRRVSLPGARDHARGDSAATTTRGRPVARLCAEPARHGRNPMAGRMANPVRPDLLPAPGAGRRTGDHADARANASSQGCEVHVMWVYWQSEPRLWSVGTIDEAGKKHPESDHGSPAEAAARVHYLNGGGAGKMATGTLGADFARMRG